MVNQCPTCKGIDSLCEQVDLEKGEVIGYICTQCGYESFEEEEKSHT